MSFNLSLSLYNDENFLSFIGACSCCVVSYPKVPSLLFVLPADPELFFSPLWCASEWGGLIYFFWRTSVGMCVYAHANSLCSE